jgi:asparagine synthetase B (glutamine-hydrolysing)
LCGIFGVAAWGDAALSPRALTETLAALFRLSERRGKEAAGLAIRSAHALAILRSPQRASRMIRGEEYRSFIEQAGAPARGPDGRIHAPFAAFGHARLVTNGRLGIGLNNQPVASVNAVAVHNGIVVNATALWERNPGLRRIAEVDSEILPALVAHYLGAGQDLEQALGSVFQDVDGEANIAMLFTDRPVLLLATNTGSLYFAADTAACVAVFASEEPILSEAVAATGRTALLRGAKIEHLRAGDAVMVDLEAEGPRRFRLHDTQRRASRAAFSKAVPLVDTTRAAEERRMRLRRCTRCVLPETIPGITFDAGGVCNQCRDYQPFQFKGLDALRALADRHRRSDGRPDCVVGLSGGRDSSYGLHYVKRELGLNPIAYTYDWALVTDLARRNQSRLCARLGVEHVLVSADIGAKRGHIRANVNAWLHRPKLGMVPLFMAGDKMYFYYYRDVATRYGIDLIITCGNRYEMTDFKSAFAGVPTKPGGARYVPYAISAAKKLRLLAYYLSNFLVNPRYLNRSLWDTTLGFYAAYVMRHEFERLYDYIPWDERTIDSTLREQYDWEEATDTETTWRIGDGTAAFYNHIYCTVAGFSEHDTFRSHQVRAGVITRDEALGLIARDNRPRFESIREYAHVIGFDFDHALTVIDRAPKLY